MDYIETIRSLFRSQDWPQKIIVAGLISILPIVGIIYILGWGLEIVRTAKTMPQLPKIWSAKYLLDGAKLGGLIIVYALPFLTCALVSKLIGGIWSAILSGFLGTAGWSVFDFASRIFLLGSILFIIFILPEIIAQYLPSATISAGLDFKSIYVRAKFDKADLLRLSIVFIAGALLSAFGFSFCFIGIIFTLPVSVAAYSIITGQSKIL